MTRINANIPVKELSDSHLLAEHREIKRICNRYRKRAESNKLMKINYDFKLGTGHELFFLDKGGFTFLRYKKLHQECLDRRFNVTDFSLAWKCYDNPEYFNDWFPTPEENDLVRLRIVERLVATKQKQKYKGGPMHKFNAICLLKFETSKYLTEFKQLIRKIVFDNDTESYLVSSCFHL